MPTIEQLDDPKSAGRLFMELARRANRIRIATAWGSPYAPVFDCLRDAQNERRLELVVGWDFEGTHPKFLRELRLSLRVMPRGGGVTFHPKAYLFIQDGKFDAIVGSSNLTRGGFSGNVELNLRISGATNERYFGDIDRYIQRQWDGSREISKLEIDNYERRWRMAKKRARHFSEPRLKLDLSHSKRQMIVDPKLDVGWTEFFRLLRKVDGTNHYVFKRKQEESYLGVIDYVQDCFARDGSLSRMEREERSNVAATNTHSVYGLFGTTHSVGSFTHAVLTTPALIDRALDRIPFDSRRPVTKAEFDSFFAEFQKFAKSLSPPRPAVGCASRLLAMKRPDSFVCVNGENRTRLARAFGFSDAELRTVSGYWKLCEHLWSLSWHRSPRPKSRYQLDAWKARVAVIDAVYSTD
jgi:hypothetical protein